VGDPQIPIQVRYRRDCRCGKSHVAYHQYVLFYRLERDYFRTGKDSERIFACLAYTDGDGCLHPITVRIMRSNGVEEKVNRVAVARDPDTGKFIFQITKFTDYTKVRNNRLGRIFYNYKLTVPPRHDFGLFFWSPNLSHKPPNGGENIYGSGRHIYETDLKRAGLLYKRRDTHVLKSLKRKRRVHPVYISSQYPIYHDALMRLTRSLNYHVESGRKQIGALMTSSTCLDQMLNRINKTGRVRYNHWFLAATPSKARPEAERLKQKHQLGHWGTFETRLLQDEFIKPLQDKVGRYVVARKGTALRNIRFTGNMLYQLMWCKAHQDAFNSYFASELGKSKPNIPEKVRQLYTNAYRLLSRSEKGEKLYTEQVQPFLKAWSPKKKKPTPRQVAGYVPFVRTLHSDLLGVVEAYSFLKVSRKLKRLAKMKNLAEEMVEATNYLESLGLARNAKSLENELIAAAKANRAIDPKQFLTDAPNSIAVRAFNKIASTIKVINAVATINDNKKKLADKVGSVKDVIDVGSELIESQSKNIPAAARYAKMGGTVSASLDWALTIEPMYAAADQGDLLEYSYSVVSFSGKGIVMGGHLLNLVRFLRLGVAGPWGMPIAAVGMAITILDIIYKEIKEYKSEDYQQFLKSEAIFKRACKEAGRHGKLLLALYNEKSKTFAPATQFALRQAERDDADVEKALKDGIKEEWGRRTIAVGNKSIIYKYFHGETWGVAEHLGKKAKLV